MNIYGNFAAAFNIIKALLPPKAVASMRFVNQKNLHEYITKENMLTCWGGTDDYEFKFVPEKIVHENGNGLDANKNVLRPTIVTTDENDNTTVVSHEKKVCRPHSHFIISYEHILNDILSISNNFEHTHFYEIERKNEKQHTSLLFLSF